MRRIWRSMCFRRHGSVPGLSCWRLCSCWGLLPGQYHARVAQETFSRRLIESQEAERKRIAAELHDSLGQNLASQMTRSEEHTSELQSLRHLVCRLLLE